MWHRRLGHLGFENLAKLAEGKLADEVKLGEEELQAEKSEICELVFWQCRQDNPSRMERVKQRGGWS